MRKFLVLIISILLVSVLAVTFVACTGDNGSQYKLELVNDVEYFEYTLGEIDWNDIKFFVYDSENNLVGDSAVVASESMVIEDDLVKLYTAGRVTITLRYQGAELKVPLKLNQPEIISEYDVTFNAGEGYFEGYEDKPNRITVTTDVLYTIPIPVRDGYEFLGWYENEDGLGNKIITPKTLVRDLRLFAKWSDMRKYNVSYVVYHDDSSKGIASTVKNVEHGQEIELLRHDPYTGYDFIRYEITNLDDQNADVTYIEYSAEKEIYNYVVTSNCEVVLRYNIKKVTLQYMSEAWKKGEVIYIPGKDPVVLTGDDSVGIYTVQVDYGTVLQKDVLPVPTLPEKEGHTGKWIDQATNKEPVYNKAVEDILVKASYEINKYYMIFCDEYGNEIPNSRRELNFGSKIQKSNIPLVTEKTGYKGIWRVENKGYVPGEAPNALVEYDLSLITMVEDVKVYAHYLPLDYTINYVFRLEGVEDEIIYPQYHYYNEIVNSPLDITKQITINEQTYEGYNGKYFIVEWYSSDKLISEKKVKFPLTVTESVNLYFKLIRTPFVVDFRLDENQERENVSIAPVRYDDIEVKFDENGTPFATITPPTWSMDGYVVDKWYYDPAAPLYDVSVSYVQGDRVFYEGNYYQALQSSIGIAPVTGEGIDQYWMRNGGRREYRGDIDIYDFHEYNVDPFYDRAFYAFTVVKEFDVTFKTLVISKVGDNYVYTYENVTDPIKVEYANLLAGRVPTSLNKPTYPDGIDSEFVFEGWYTENQFVTLPVDMDKVKVTSDLVFYAKWTDNKVGTAGLVYIPDDINNPTAYYVSGFETNLAEYSHVIIRIPQIYNNRPVVGILDYAFSKFDKVLYIDEIILPSTLNTIGDNVFSACYSLTDIDLQGNSNFVFEDGSLYSSDKTKLYLVTKVNDDGEYTIPSNTREIVGGAFSNLSNLKKVVIEGNMLETIGAYSFDGCNSLETIKIPTSVASIGEYAFRGCYSLGEVAITTDSSLRRVGIGAFNDCLTALTYVEDKEYYKLGSVLISYVGDATELTISAYDGIVSIGDGAFNREFVSGNSSNYQLTKLTIENSCVIGRNVFLGCSNLYEIYLLSDTKVEIESTSFNGINASAVLYVSSDCIEEYLSDSNYTSFFGSENIFIK